MSLSSMLKKWTTGNEDNGLPMSAVGKLLTMAKLQGGMFMAQQATIRGVHKRHLDMLVADGTIEEVMPGMYRVLKK
ncbi:MAG: type IV toxin-antitoxin system AbiEi family antitoxin domain-containing protein [Eggerthellaceae bacterium]|nr:type IV toxin-antitoxin system AbiEi family antitoxin domain-containing protein [Eggerthellaceae bacterium]